MTYSLNSRERIFRVLDDLFWLIEKSPEDLKPQVWHLILRVLYCAGALEWSTPFSH